MGATPESVGCHVFNARNNVLVLFYINTLSLAFLEVAKTGIIFSPPKSVPAVDFLHHYVSTEG